ncbi:MAG: hypothetical protein ACYCWW_09060 [Deltaproteobacteria bacterium]
MRLNSILAAVALVASAPAFAVQKKPTYAEGALKASEYEMKALKAHLAKLEAKRPRDLETVKQIALAKEEIKKLEERRAFLRAHPDYTPFKKDKSPVGPMPRQ